MTIATRKESFPIREGLFFIYTFVYTVIRDFRTLANFSYTIANL